MIKWREAKGRTRTFKVEVRLNEIEYAKLKNDITEAQTTISDYLRKLIINGKVKQKPGYDFYLVMKEMNHIGINLNQLTKKANSLNYIDKDEYKFQAKEWEKFTKKVKDKYL